MKDLNAFGVQGIPSEVAAQIHEKLWALAVLSIREVF
jgi:hypothetical protein